MFVIHVRKIYGYTKNNYIFKLFYMYFKFLVTLSFFFSNMVKEYQYVGIFVHNYVFIIM